MRASHRLHIIAGSSAYHRIATGGLNADDFSHMVGASGGPKWFSLFGLDQYLAGEFFQQRKKPLQLVGSSAGAWRFACYGQADPVAAIQRFGQAYSQIDYPKTASSAEISTISAGILDAIFKQPLHQQQVLENPIFQLNFVVAKQQRWLQSAKKWPQLSGLLLAAAANLLKRDYLGRFYQRVIFEHPIADQLFLPSDKLPTQRVRLSTENIKMALLASGAIPLLLDPVADIPGAGPGLYVDGGLTDYHFDWPFYGDGLVLYPHFYPRLTPGWFDKSLRWRKAATRHLHNMVIVCPSPAWVASLPYGKIPDRTDFKYLSQTQRYTYWQEVLNRSAELAADFKQQQFQLFHLK